MEWLRKISAAIDYIETNLDKDLSYEEAARIACCSPYYFQRIFSYISGITLSEYVRRRKMTQAAFELQRTESKVIDIALKYGYSSPTSFNRAFQNVHGITPMLAKNMGCTLSAYPPIKFSIKVTGGEEMSYHIEKKENIRIVGIKTPLTEDLEENMRIVPMFWEQALDNNQISKLSKLSNGKPTGIMGVSVYTNPQDIYYYIAVASDVPIFDDITEFVIPEAMWVVFENDGLFKEDVQSVFHRFLTEFLPFSGYEYAGLPDIEIYPISEGRPTKGHSEVWIAIKKTKES
ncbi:AraC family transcriptional regulator [Eubacterium sp. OM08-24]|jgi:AraC family transcriptional regulator|uniref:AraC family transcriptional regulator n=1 Tax=Eubacterium sp. OM08-24 TaxID=2292352 RepID=UPI000E439AD6|nr:AraC family transcriptional regulator [Eubacterium sp. OM08-24]RGM19425.1 AraC family transcriptional regulator [Eubacterium sp. OM08-24]